MTYPKRLIEVDLPIARISAHARREKSIRHGHISTLHIWWARRPLAACRAVICAALWPDPADALCPQSFRDLAMKAITEFAERMLGKRNVSASGLLNSCSPESITRWETVVNADILRRPIEDENHNVLRLALLDFIADFANWDNSTVPEYLAAARAITQAAHEALGGEPGTRPLVVDPFAGGGSIPLEALRVGADAFASDLNPIPVLLNKVVLEYIPKYGQRLADAVRKWGQWIKEKAETELAQFYPEDRARPPRKGDKDDKGDPPATPIAYLWARTILSEAPGQGDIPIEVPMMRSLWLARKTSRKRALRWVRDENGKVKTQTVEVNYYIDGKATPTRVRRPLLEIFEPAKESEVEGGTVARGSATCPVTGFTTKVDSVRAQLKKRRGGAADARMFCVVTTRHTEPGRFYRLPTKADQAAFDAAAAELERRERADGTERSRAGRAAGHRSAAAGADKEHRRSLVPDEVISLNELRRVSLPIYGMERWGDLFSPRQALTLTTLSRLVREAASQMIIDHEYTVPIEKVTTLNKAALNLAGTESQQLMDAGLAEAVTTCLALAASKQADRDCSICRWISQNENIGYTFGRQAIPMLWDFVEAPTFTSGGGWVGIFSDICETIGNLYFGGVPGHVQQASATNHPMPDDTAAAMITDPPYYDAVPYAYLSDFFYVWLRRTLAELHPALFNDSGVPKDAEIVVDRPHKLSQSTKGIVFYERELTKAFAEARRVLAPSGVATIVFASKTTASWEAILKAVIDAGFIITGSWPIDTEREARVAAQGQARLGSSVHLVCRPREFPVGTLHSAEVGDWRDVLQELPRRIHEWMPRLAQEGVVGADAIFACLGPALEVFSRYARVEKASGEVATLGEYLEHIWAAVSTEALSMIFQDADAAGLEPDARLTAMWLWTLGGGKPSKDGNGKATEGDEANESPDDDEESSSVPITTGYSLEFDAARKIAQGLGIHLEKSESIVEVKGETARLLSVADRTRHLFGLTGENGTATPGKKPKKKPQQSKLFAEFIESEAVEAVWADLKGPPPGTTVLDRLHQAMILFAAGRGELMKRFLLDDGVGSDARFWKLAQSLSALYPTGTEEKRWVDGVLARKKGLGL